MKEVILFKPTEILPESGAVVTYSARAHESAFYFHEFSKGDQTFPIHLHAAEGSTLEVVLFQNAPLIENILIQIHAQAEKNSKLKMIVVQTGGNKAQIDLDSEAVGAGARIEVVGLHSPREKQKFLLRANAVHSIPHTSSDLKVWCAARDESQSIFNGLVTIKPGAHHTEAYQKNKNLILSPRATIDSFPKLLIANDDVKCAHGSSTSSLEPDQAYYLQSRGIASAEAELMMVSGFLRQALSEISDRSCQKALEEKLGVLEEEWS